MARHKGKRTKSKRDSSSPDASATTPRAASGSSTTSTRPEVEGLRVEGNVIHLPKPSASGEESATARTTVRAGSGWGEGERPSDENPLRSDDDEGQRSTVPPEAPEADGSEVSGEVLAPASSAATRSDEADEKKADEPEAKTVGEADEKKADAPEAKKADEKKADAPEAKKADEKKADEKKADAPEAKKADEKKTESKRDVTLGRAERRDRKESLSAHLSDEAKAFFSDKSLEAAYKPHHDNFEDLTPAHEDHAHDVARSRKWMRVTGMLLVGVVAVVGAFALQSRYGVQETDIRTQQFRSTPVPSASVTPPETPTPPQSSATTAPPASPATPAAPETAVAPAAPETAVAPAAPETAVAPAAPETAVAPAAPETAVAPAAPETAVAPAAPAPAAGDPAELLAAARRANRIDAWEAYFNAAPTEDGLMARTAMAFAERGRASDAERLAQRAVTANPNNGQGWFVLAYARNALRNRDGAREAKARCIAIGGTWARECRAL